MRLCYRIALSCHANLKGVGGLYADGRWHSQGRSIVYAAETRSLAALDVLVNLDLPPELTPENYVIMEIAVPKNVSLRRLRLTKKLVGWNKKHGEVICRQVGDAWLQKQDAAILEVPSVVVPEEKNLLINPAHPDAQCVKIMNISSFSFDARLLKF